MKASTVRNAAMGLIMGVGFGLTTTSVFADMHGKGMDKGMMGDQKGGMMQMSGMMHDMADNMMSMSGEMGKGNMSADRQKQMGSQMRDMSMMMDKMSGMMGKGMMMDADQQKQMGEMRKQMDTMQKGSPAATDSKKLHLHPRDGK